VGGVTAYSFGDGCVEPERGIRGATLDVLVLLRTDEEHLRGLGYLE
jgi:hypothetical protein